MCTAFCCTIPGGGRRTSEIAPSKITKNRKSQHPKSRRTGNSNFRNHEELEIATSEITKNWKSQLPKSRRTTNRTFQNHEEPEIATSEITKNRKSQLPKSRKMGNTVFHFGPFSIPKTQTIDSNLAAKSPGDGITQAAWGPSCLKRRRAMGAAHFMCGVWEGTLPSS